MEVWNFHSTVKETEDQNFPGGPVVKALCSQDRRRGYEPWSGTKIPHAAQCGKKKKKTKERNRGLITLSKVRKLERDWITIRTPFWALPLLLFTTIPSILSFHGGPYYGSVHQSHSESKLFTKTLKKKKWSTPIPLSPNRLSHVLIPSSSSVSWFIFSGVKTQKSGSGSEITTCIQILAQALTLCHTCPVLTGKMSITVISASQDDGGE